MQTPTNNQAFESIDVSQENQVAWAWDLDKAEVNQTPPVFELLLTGETPERPK